MSAERAHGPLQILDIEPALLHACVILRTSIERDMENLERLIVAPFVQTRFDGFSSKTAFLSLGLKFRVSFRMLCLLWVTSIWPNEIAV